MIVTRVLLLAVATSSLLAALPRAAHAAGAQDSVVPEDILEVASNGHPRHVLVAEKSTQHIRRRIRTKRGHRRVCR